MTKKDKSKSNLYTREITATNQLYKSRLIVFFLKFNVDFNALI